MSGNERVKKSEVKNEKEKKGKREDDGEGGN